MEGDAQQLESTPSLPDHYSPLIPKKGEESPYMSLSHTHSNSNLGQETSGLLADEGGITAGGLEVENPFQSVEDTSQKPLIKRVLGGAVTGVGFLSDAFDLFIINVVMVIMKQVYPEIKEWTAEIASSVLVGAVIGQLVFGVLADKIGRRVGFIITLLLVIVGSIASGLSFSTGSLTVFHCLVFWRFVLGVGVGGEYPLSATITAETSSTQKRGKNTAAVFSMQGVGSLLATIVAFTFYKMMPDNLGLVWRLSLAFGAAPGIIMFYFRVKMEETQRFAAVKSGHQTLPVVNYREIFRKYWKRLLGTAGSWFLLDVTFYANGLFSATILEVAQVGEDLSSVLTFNIYLSLISLPGYWVAVFLIERIGRKTLQFAGFATLSLLYLMMGLLFSYIRQSPVAFFILYGLTFFFTNAGANPTTYVLPSESFPTEVRATCHGISAACGKLGAVVGAAAMTPLLHKYGLSTVLLICAVVAGLGGIHTLLFTLETKGKSLEELENEENSWEPTWIPKFFRKTAASM